MSIEVRSGSYGIYEGVQYKLVKKSNGDLILQAHYDLDLEKKGFQPYQIENLFDKMYKKVLPEELESGFYVETFCRYKGLKFKMDVAFNEQKQAYRIWPLFESFEALNLDHKNDNAHFWVNEGQLSEVWEVREPFAGFPFTVDRLFYIKGHPKK